LIAPGLLACGDYIDGPYPATLEGAVRSGLAAARLLAQGDGAPAGGH
jgi:predicted NAD/FAD-dependent oxidoreductase